MKSKKEVLEYYGKCCVSEYTLTKGRVYESGSRGDDMKRRDDRKVENILGQKKAIEFIFE